MSLWTIVLRNLAQRKLSSALTAASVSLGVAVVVTVLALKAQSLEGFARCARYHLVVGPKGSALQLVLGTVYHLDELSATMPWARYKELAAHKAVKFAVPISVGDQVGGFRVVATTDAFFDLEIEAGRPPEIEGRRFKFNAEQLEHAMAGHGEGHEHGGDFEAVAGSTAAKALGLAVGSPLLASHGLADGGEKHQETWTVVGVMKPTGTPHDRAVFINLDSFYGIRDHRAAARLSAVLVEARGGNAPDQLRAEINDWPDAMAVKPSLVIEDLFQLIGKVDILLLAVAVLVIVVGAVSILVSIYNSMAERRRAIAILRALGARRTTILSIVILEAAALCFFGGAAGLFLGHLLTAVASRVLSEGAGVSISAVSFDPRELGILAAVVLLGVLAGVVPALRAYRTDIADGLSPSS